MGRQIGHGSLGRATPSDSSRRNTYPFPTALFSRTPATIPSVLCIGRWNTRFISDLDGWQELTIIWFQEGFCTAIDPEVVRQIKTVDWDNLCALIEH